VGGGGQRPLVPLLLSGKVFEFYGTDKYLKYLKVKKCTYAVSGFSPA
jgi:hypothetical protein